MIDLCVALVDEDGNVSFLFLDVVDCGLAYPRSHQGWGSARGYCRDSFDQPGSVEKLGRSEDKPSGIVIKETFQSWAKLSTIQHGTGIRWQCYYECGDGDFVSLS